MQNQNTSPQPTPDTTRRLRHATAGVRTHRTRYYLAAGAVVAIGAMVGTGFAVQSAFAAQHDRMAATTALAAAGRLDAGQLASHSTVLTARADKTAADTLTVAKSAIAAAGGKTDASKLATATAQLEEYRLLAPQRVFELAKTTGDEALGVQAAIAEFDRQAAAKAAAEAAAKAAAAAASAASSASSSTPAPPANPTDAQQLARQLMSQLYGWGDDQFGCLVPLWAHESGWRTTAGNASGAYGIPQALPGSKMSSFGDDWATNPATQIKWGLSYISGRYGTPCNAWSSWQSNGWY